MKEYSKTGSPENTGHTAEALAQPPIRKSNGERALFALSNDEPAADFPCPGVADHGWFEEFVKSAPSATELATRAARPGKRLEECEKFWRREMRCIDEERHAFTWEQLRPNFDLDFQSSVDEAMEEVNNVRGPRVIYYGNHECPDDVLANLLRAWYHLPAEEDVLLFVNDRAKYAYFLPNWNPYVEGGELLGWDASSWAKDGSSTSEDAK